jgi:uncharacterized protein (UPF0548 family)
MIVVSDRHGAGVTRHLDRARDEVLTYDEVGQTRSPNLPAGYRHDRLSLLVGRHELAWERACDAIRTWRAHTNAGITITPVDAPIAKGVTVMASRRFGPATLLAPCRIVYRTDEPSRFGFAYGTLVGHPEQGEEAFHVVRHDDGAVTAEIIAFSRPYDLSTRLAGPVAREIQKLVTRRYLQGIKTYASQRE